MSSYVSQQFLLHDSSSVANFKNWAQAISVAIAAMGWIQTSDTGQVNWSSIASVPGSGSYVYEIWRPADALQTGSTAYFLRIEYGNGTSPVFRISIAHSTDGAGNLQAPVTPVFNSQGTGGEGSTTVRECNFSGDIDRMSINMWRDSNNSTSASSFCIERTHNTDGTPSSDGASIFANFNNGISPGQSTLVFSPLLVYTLNSGQNFCHLYTNVSDLANNNGVPVSPLFPVYLGKFGNPATGMCLVPQNDIAEGGIFTTTIYGATRTYLASKRIAFANQAVCIRYD